MSQQVKIQVEDPTEARPILVATGFNGSLRVNGIQIGSKETVPFEILLEMPEGVPFLNPPLLWGSAPAAFGEEVVFSRSGSSFSLTNRAGQYSGTFEAFPLYGQLAGESVTGKYWFPVQIVNEPPLTLQEAAVPRFAHLRVDDAFSAVPVLTLVHPEEGGWITVEDNTVTIRPRNPNDLCTLTFHVDQGRFFFPACLWTQQPTNITPPAASGRTCQMTFTPTLPVEPKHNIFFFHFEDPPGQPQLIDPVLTENPPTYGGEPPV